jgi:predicted dehydrogenase
MNSLGVGIIGASPLNPGWAVNAHIPALKALPDYELRVVSTSRRESAGVRTAVGLQARFAPAIRRARDLIVDGYMDFQQ